MNNKKRNTHNHGYTLIELIIVVAIIAVLTAMAVPYYKDYIYDSRVGVLKQNMANIRKVINQFRGDMLRGPYLVAVASGGTIIHNSQINGLTSDSELSGGPIQIISADPLKFMRRTNLKYLPAVPELYDPVDGSRITKFNTATSSSYFVDYDTTSGAGVYDIDKDFAYYEGNNTTKYDDSSYDKVILNETGKPDSDFIGSPTLPLDYIDFTVKSSDGSVY